MPIAILILHFYLYYVLPYYTILHCTVNWYYCTHRITAMNTSTNIGSMPILKLTLSLRPILILQLMPTRALILIPCYTIIYFIIPCRYILHSHIVHLDISFTKKRRSCPFYVSITCMTFPSKLHIDGYISLSRWLWGLGAASGIAGLAGSSLHTFSDSFSTSLFSTKTLNTLGNPWNVFEYLYTCNTCLDKLANLRDFRRRSFWKVM